MQKGAPPQPPQLGRARSSTLAQPNAPPPQAALGNVLLFKNLDPGIQRKVVSSMWERVVPAGEILIQEGDTGLAASELYVVKEGKFEVRAAWRAAWRACGGVTWCMARAHGNPWRAHTSQGSRMGAHRGVGPAGVLHARMAGIPGSATPA